MTEHDAEPVTPGRPRRRRLRLVLVVLVAVLGVVAVVGAVVVSNRAGTEKDVRAAFSDYLQALSTSDCAELERLNPSTTKKDCTTLTKDMDGDQRRQLADAFKAFEVTSVKVDGDEATLRYTADFKQFGAATEHGTVTLVRVDDQWTIDKLS